MDELFTDLLSHGPIGFAVIVLILVTRNHNTSIKQMGKQCDERHDLQLIQDGKLKAEDAKHSQSLATFGENMKRVTSMLDALEERIRGNERSVTKVQAVLNSK